MSDGDQYRIDELRVTGKPLGRHVDHDPRSRAYRVVVQDTPPASKVWPHPQKPLDQGMLGSCTGNALTQVAGTPPFRRRYRHYTEATAVAVYERATVIDGFPGAYPPDDTGSSGLAACKALVERGLASAYWWGFGIDDLTKTVAQNGPAAVGVDWHSGFDVPDSDGLVHPSGVIRGGHEFAVLGWHADTTLGAPRAGVFECLNSWGISYGKAGRFFVTHDDMGALLAANGDCVTLTP
jgi:hypothetical protein